MSLYPEHADLNTQQNTPVQQAFLEHDETTPHRLSKLDLWWAQILGNPRLFRIWTWAAPLGIVLLATVLRLWNLAYPAQLMFDETYYVKDAWSLWNLGYESAWPENVNDRFAQGEVNLFTSNPSFVAHPPFGKWIIGFGMWLFGPENPASWRIMAALAGILGVLLVFFIMRDLFSSTLVGAMAAFIMAIDGHAISMSRIGLLDGFVMLFGLAAFWCMVKDWRYTDKIMSQRIALYPPGSQLFKFGPTLWWRPWLLAAAILLGLAAGTKWNGFYFLAVFGVFSVATDLLARRRHGIKFYVTGSMSQQAPVNLLTMVPPALIVYIATWSGWIFTQGGYGRNWAQTEGQAWEGLLSWVPLWFQNLWHYQTAMYNFAINLSTSHTYSSNPLSWILNIRPVLMHFKTFYEGDSGCLSSSCVTLLTTLGNPLIWWAAAAAVLFLIYALISYKTWQYGIILVGLIASYIPWFFYLDRTTFHFYSIVFLPYTIMSLTAVLVFIMGRSTDPIKKRRNSILIVAIFFVLIIAISIFFWPLASASMTPEEQWRWRIWLPSWI